MRCKRIMPLLAAFCLMMLAGAAAADTLVDSPFITDYDGWTDAYTGTTWVGSSLPLWGVLVNNNALCELSRGAESNGGTVEDPTNGVAGDSQYRPWLMVNQNYSTPSQYTLTGMLSSTDIDGVGLVFAYQDNNNYMRVGVRNRDPLDEEKGDNAGFPKGISIDKVENGVITQIATPNSDFAYSEENDPFELRVEVNGSTCNVYGPKKNPFGGAITTELYYSGSIPELATLGNHYGVLSWQNGFDGDDDDEEVKRCFGTQLHSLTVDDDSNGSIDRNHTFENVSPLPWRELYMSNSVGLGVSLEYDKGNFRIALDRPSIIDDSNPFEYATVDAPNTDFIGSAIALDDPTAANMEDYQMQVRIECGDDEGPGLLVRVQDDNTFYRINFADQGSGTGTTRPHAGMSIQKCDGREGGNPEWTELFYEESSPFLYTNMVDHGETFPFDVKVTVTNNEDDTATTIRVELIDDPEELATSYVWEVVDDSNPITTGAVGLANWGAGNVGYGQSIGVRWSGYGGDPDAPLVVTVPEIPDLPGDADRNGVVDELDAQALADNWGLSGREWEHGDFNGDHIVNVLDAAILAANWTGDAENETTAAPEPGILALLAGAMVALFARRRR